MPEDATPRYEAIVPPNDIDAEYSVIGSILLNAQALESVIGTLQAKDFYRASNGQIFDAALDLHRRGLPVDNVTVSALLEERGQLAVIGGRAHLALIEQGVPTSENVRAYAEIVLDRSMRRTLIMMADRLAGRAYDPGQPVEETLLALQKVAARMRDQVAAKRRSLRATQRPELRLVDVSANAEQVTKTDLDQRANQRRA